MEILSNWGSAGRLLADNAVVSGTDFGRQPFNDWQADTASRTQIFSIERQLTTLTFEVDDITDESEIVIDDIAVYTSPAGARGHSGKGVAGTVLGGNYAANSSGRLISPSFIVPPSGAGSRPAASFWQWYQYGTGDTGTVQVTAFDGLQWGAWQTLAVAAFGNSTTNWEQTVVDLSPFAGQKIRLGFQHSANGDGSVGAGWYLDDLEIVGYATTPLTFVGAASNRFVRSGQSYLYSVTVPAGSNLLVTLKDLDGLGVNEAYLRSGLLPTRGTYDRRLTSSGVAEMLAFAPNVGPDTWHILAYNASGTLPGDFTLSARMPTLNPCYFHAGLLITNEVWSTERVHFVTKTVTVLSGVTLTIQPGAIVKFMDGSGIVVLSGGACIGNSVTFTHWADDAVGGDLLGDGDATRPMADAYVLAGSVTIDSATLTRYWSVKLSGTLSTSQTWFSGRIYQVTGNITVPTGVTLTILPGAIVKVGAGLSITINSGGALNAVGSRAQPIVFTSYKDDRFGGDTNGDGNNSYPGLGDWGCVLLNAGTGTFAYCTFQYGVNGNKA